MVTDAQGVRYDRQRGIDRAAGDKETRIYYIYVIQIVCLAIRDLIVGRTFHPLLLSLNIVLQIQDLLQFKKDFAK